MKKICFIYSAGEYYGSEIFPLLTEGCFLVAADRGLEKMLENGLEPDLVVGDFDSLGYVPELPNIIKLPSEKDFSDTEIAIKEGEKRGLDTFVIYGGLGGRLDHTISNIQSLYRLCKLGKSGYLIGENTVITAIKNSSIAFPEKLCGTISVFAAGRADGVTINGLKYEISNVTLENTSPIGLSNEFIGKKAEISVRDGTLLIIWNESAKDLIERL